MSDLKFVPSRIDYEKYLRADEYRITRKKTWRFFMETGIDTVLGRDNEEILIKSIELINLEIEELNKRKAEKQKELLELRERQKEEELLRQREAIILPDESEIYDVPFCYVIQKKENCSYCSKKFPRDDLAENPRTKKLFCNSCSKIVIKEERKIQIRT